MKSRLRSLLRRRPWTSKHRTCGPVPPSHDLVGQPATWNARSVPSSELDAHLERESGQAATPPSPSALLDRATALRVKEFLRAREESLRVHCSIPANKQLYLGRFSRCLREAHANPTDRETAKELWRLYTKMHLHSPDFLRALPTKAWDVLWASQSLRTPDEPKIVAHLIQMAEDMRKAGHGPSFHQTLIHIETLFGKGDHKKAIDEWQRGYKTDAGRTQDSYRPEYLDLGIRMFAVVGNVTQARDMLIELFASHPDWNPRLILYVVDAYVALTGRPTCHKQAWALYQCLRHLLGDEMTLEDYERCYVGFLKAGDRTYATAIFHDFLLHGQNLRNPPGEKEKRMIVESFKKMARTATDVDGINAPFLAAISSMSLEPQGKRFYTEWIQILTKRGHPDAAAQVVELMYERGVAPQARHLNPLIEAWISAGTPDLAQKAETLGLQMIVERISLVRHRAGMSESTAKGPQLNQRSRPKLFLRRSIPPAISITFELLAKLYLKQGDKKKLDDLRLWQTRYAKLPTTTTALKAEMSYFLQHGYLSDVWRVFKREVLRQSTPDLAATRPDAATFALLWEASRMKPRTLTRSSLYRLGGGRRTSFPPPAIVLRHTLSWLACARLSEPRRAHADLVAHIARSRIPTRIVATFCAWNDVAGALVALHVLARRLAVPPSHENARALATALARLAFRARTARQRRDVGASAALAHTLERVLRALRVLVERRLATAEERGGKGPEELGEGGRNDVFLDALSELVRAALVRQGLPPREVEGRIAGVKRVVGVEDLRIGDKDASDVARTMGIQVEEKKEEEEEEE